MSIELPLPVKTYLDAITTRDVEALDTCMTPDVRINDPDDEQAANGMEAVKVWFQDNCLQHNLRVEATDTRFENGTCFVTVKTAGDFPGSPFFFDYHFVLAGDRIQNLDIRLVESPSLATISNPAASGTESKAEPPHPDSVASMTVSQIMAALSRFDYVLPEAALNAAEAQREAITPLLLAELQRYAVGKPDSSDDGYTLAMFGTYLLAHFRESRALTQIRIFLDNFPNDSDALDAIGLIDDGTRILASLALANPKALRPFIENKSYYETIRGDALEAHIALWVNGVVNPEEMRDYLRHLAENVFAREAGGPDQWVWYAWARCCIDFGFEEYYPIVKTAFESEWIDPSISNWEYEEKDIAKGRECILERARKEYGRLIGNVADEMHHWYCFTEKARQDDLKQKAKWKRDRAKRERQYNADHQPKEHDDFIPVGTIVNDKPKTKPNQPCPCGSGKKYKKCCGR